MRDLLLESRARVIGCQTGCTVSRSGLGGAAAERHRIFCRTAQPIVRRSPARFAPGNRLHTGPKVKFVYVENVTPRHASVSTSLFVVGPQHERIDVLAIALAHALHKDAADGNHKFEGGLRINA